MMKLVVLCCVVAAATARAPVYFAPAALPSVLPVGYAAPLQQPLYNYRGPLSLAPGQPANILAADGRPLDTLDVNLDRTAHFVAKAIDNAHVLKKRSVTRLAVAPGPVGFSTAVAAGNVGIAAPVALSPTGVAATIATNPVGLSAPVLAGSIGPFGPFTTVGLTTPVAAGSLVVSTPVAAGSLAVSTPLAAGPIAVSSPVAVDPIGVAVAGTSFARNF